MPTYEKLPRFQKDYDRLSPEERTRFKQAITSLIEDIERGAGFRVGLRVRGIQGAPGIFEMTWAPGRATFEYGKPPQEGEVHVRWRRVGTHAVLDNP
jgi:hypothetical protein